jgi:hypothetical protein
MNEQMYYIQARGLFRRLAAALELHPIGHRHLAQSVARGEEAFCGAG